LLAGLSAMVEAVLSFVKGVHAFKNDDDDAGQWYIGSGFFLLLSGATGIAGALAIASGAEALTGVVGFLASAGIAVAQIPVWGWIAAGVVLLGIGLIMLWKAINATDTPLEQWLKHCIYGKGSKRMDAKDEMQTLNDISYAMTIEVGWDGAAWHLTKSDFKDGYDTFHFGITLPGVGANSVIDCRVTLIGKGVQKEVFHETIRPRMVGNRAIDPHMPVMSALPSSRPTTPRWVWDAPPQIDDGGRQFRGVAKVDGSVYSSGEVEIKYWPDAKTMPEFVLPKVLDQRTLKAAS
jgi:hypothetical protein